MGYKKMDQSLGFADLALASSIMFDRTNRIKQISAPGEQYPGQFTLLNCP